MRNNVIEIVEAGGGGDCFFHSVSAALSRSRGAENYMVVRTAAADAVNGDNVDEFLMDLSGTPMDGPNEEMSPTASRSAATPGGAFSALSLWNETLNRPAERVSRLKAALVTPGGYFEGENPIAGLLEESYGINIICLNTNTRTNVPRATVYELGKVASLSEKWQSRKRPSSRSPRASRPSIVIHNHPGHWQAVSFTSDDLGKRFILDPDEYEDFMRSFP